MSRRHYLLFNEMSTDVLQGASLENPPQFIETKLRLALQI